jgi:alpha-glucuronidase
MTAVSFERNTCLRFNKIINIWPFWGDLPLILGLGVLLLGVGVPLREARAEDGYRLWLRYEKLEMARVQPYRHAATELVSTPESPTSNAARAELLRALDAMLGTVPAEVPRPTQDGAVILGTPRSSSVIAALHLDLRAVGEEGYLIRSVSVDGHSATVISANRDIGVLYGVFRWLRLIQTLQPIDHLNVLSAPHLRHRVLDHWDNLDGFVERGYAGASLWDWQKLPDYLDPRYSDYARACASLGINGTILTNVNASALSLTPEYLRKAAALADVFRAYGLRVYLSARFSAPMEIGGLQTADPLDPEVRAWWRAKTEEIYRGIPDFGGFLVKSNSEGQPGPQDYGRSHADGANMLADALAPHGGIVMWRAFVYSQKEPADRATQAYTEFVPLDGKFHDNVLVQIKNGPIDFQPREPFHPAFGAMPKTSLMLEVQVTKEYLGFATHLAYLGTMWQETLDADTYAHGPGSLVRSQIAGMAGVANIGADRNWTGSHFDQANWYAFGRLAWDPELDARAVADEWVRMTFSNDPRFVDPVVDMMMRSREAVVDYMTPLGLHHQMANGHHYGPGPWVTGAPRADWTSTYFNRADSGGIGFDRTSRGSNAVSQYAPEIAARFEDPKRTPENLLLWFHHLPWDYTLASGNTLWDELVRHYSHGVDTVASMRKIWATLAPLIDAERAAQITAFLAIQEKEAQWWRDASIAYFQSVSRRPLPPGFAPPPHTLEYYEALCFPYAPGNPGAHSPTCAN